MTEFIEGVDVDVIIDPHHCVYLPVIRGCAQRCSTSRPLSAVRPVLLVVVVSLSPLFDTSAAVRSSLPGMTPR
ncbi:hypothetical protein Pelo_13786 [Pelomyxa schiedti]|nr:hypothetical protein Pelo_13786 [Pelomyxa schiedti]